MDNVNKHLSRFYEGCKFWGILAGAVITLVAILRYIPWVFVGLAVVGIIYLTGACIKDDESKGEARFVPGTHNW